MQALEDGSQTLVLKVGALWGMTALIRDLLGLSGCRESYVQNFGEASANPKEYPYVQAC